MLIFASVHDGECRAGGMPGGQGSREMVHNANSHLLNSAGSTFVLCGFNFCLIARWCLTARGATYLSDLVLVTLAC